jgi:hypothetical protein
VRRGADGARDVVVTANLADHPARLPTPPGAWRLRLSTAETRFGGDGAPAEAHGGVELCLPPRCAALWSSPSRPARRS